MRHSSEAAMPDEIPLLPGIPEPLLLAARSGRVVPFVGAGTSRLGGCPGWEEFADKALAWFVKESILNHAQAEQLRTLSPRVKLSIVAELEEEHRTAVDFKSILAARDGEGIGGRIHEALATLGRVQITTNYDEGLDSVSGAVRSALTTPGGEEARTIPPNRRVLFKPHQFDAASLDGPNTVIHIHGSVRDRETMVITTADYLRLYAGHSVNGGSVKENPYLSFLDVLFRTRCVLFVGYGLGELEVLEYVIQKARDTNRGSPRGFRAEPGHYMLQGFYSHQAELMRSLKTYYLKECGVGLLPFCLDVRGHEQLCHVVEHLSRALPIGPALMTPVRLEMEELLS